MVVRPPAILPLVGCDFGEVVRLVRLNDLVLVGLPGFHPFLADLVVDRARLGEMLAAGDLRGFAEDAVNALRDQLVVHVADGRAGREAGRGVALTALGRHPQLGNIALFALELGGPLHVVLGDARCLRDRVDVAVELDAEAGHRLAGLLDALDDAGGPAVLNADDDDRGDVWIGAGADQRAEMQFEVLAELQTSIGVRNRHRTFDVVGDRLARGIREIVERQNDDVVSHTDAVVLPPPAHERHIRFAVALRGLGSAFCHFTTAWS